MAIGIGLHCWYCEHGPCNNECHEQEEKARQRAESERLEFEKLPEFEKRKLKSGFRKGETFNLSEARRRLKAREERLEERKLIRKYKDKIKRILEKKHER